MRSYVYKIPACRSFFRSNYMENLLKGNFETQRKVQTKEITPADVGVSQRRQQKVMASLGGSMVYIEKTPLSWDG